RSGPATREASSPGPRATRRTTTTRSTPRGTVRPRSSRARTAAAAATRAATRAPSLRPRAPAERAWTQRPAAAAMRCRPPTRRAVAAPARRRLRAARRVRWAGCSACCCSAYGDGSRPPRPQLGLGPAERLEVVLAQRGVAGGEELVELRRRHRGAAEHRVRLPAMVNLVPEQVQQQAIAALHLIVI